MSLRAALLTMIGNAPRSGYELKASFDGSLGFVWQATHQQIYQELKRLVSDGLARVQEAPARGRQAGGNQVTPMNHTPQLNSPADPPHAPPR